MLSTSPPRGEGGRSQARSGRTTGLTLIPIHIHQLVQEVPHTGDALHQEGVEGGQPQLLALAQLLAQVPDALHRLEQRRKEAEVTAEASGLWNPKLCSHICTPWVPADPPLPFRTSTQFPPSTQHCPILSRVLGDLSEPQVVATLSRMA